MIFLRNHLTGRDGKAANFLDCGQVGLGDDFVERSSLHELPRGEEQPERRPSLFDVLFTELLPPEKCQEVADDFFDENLKLEHVKFALLGIVPDRVVQLSSRTIKNRKTCILT